MYIATKLLITTLTTIPASTTVGDLCDVVNRETGTPTICLPHKEGAPKYDGNVCCADDTCFSAVKGCREREELYYCGLGEEISTGEVLCYFEVPDYCQVFGCPVVVAPFTWESTICCQWDYCFELTPYSEPCQVDDIYSCGDLVSNPDGSVTCVDNE